MLPHRYLCIRVERKKRVSKHQLHWLVLEHTTWAQCRFHGEASVSRGRNWQQVCTEKGMIRKLKSGQFRLYSRKKDAKGKRKNLGTFSSRAAAEKHERAVQYFKRAG